MGFIDTMRAQGFAVESICQVLGDQGVQVAARTYRAWKAPGRQVAARTISDAVLADALLGARTSSDGRPTPESLYGRRKMTALLRRGGLAVGHCTVDRLMGELACTACAGASSQDHDLQHRHSSPCRRPAGPRLHRASAQPGLDCRLHLRADLGRDGLCRVRRGRRRPAHRGLAHDAHPPGRAGPAPAAHGRQGSRAAGPPIARGELVHHSDAGSQDLAIRFTEHLQLEEITPSVGSVGDAYDNALMESIIGLYKV